MRCIESLKDTSIMTTNMTIIIMIIKYKKNLMCTETSLFFIKNIVDLKNKI